MSAKNGLVQKLWGYANVLRDDGLSYGDYLEQLTYLLFLKMADEQTKPPFDGERIVPEGYDWPSLLARDGDDLEVHYRHVLEELGRKSGMMGIVFRKAQNKIQNPALLRRLIADLIDRETWLTLGVDVKGDAYEGLLERNAEDVKTGAGQYFTPRPLIGAIVDVMRPEPGMRICDPACGTNGFLLAAHDFIASTAMLDPDQRHHLRYEALRGWEIVDATARLRDEPAPPRDRRRGRGEPDRRRRRAQGRSGRAVRAGADEPAVREEVGDRLRGRGRGRGAGVAGGRPRRLLGLDVEQAAQLRPAREDAAEARRSGRGGRPGQRPLRGRRRRDGAAQAAARVRCSHPPAAADRHLLRAGREGEMVGGRAQASSSRTRSSSARSASSSRRPAARFIATRSS